MLSLSKIFRGIVNMIFGNGETTHHEETKVEKPLGFIAQKYESSDSGPGTIADVPGDGGGKAYGIFQFDSHFRHLKLYVLQSQYAAIFFGQKIASEEFDIEWKRLAKLDGILFEQSQRDYATKVYYNPAIAFAKTQGFDTSSRAIQEAIFSIALQHGGWKTILKSARRIEMGTVAQQISSLYQSRRSYIQKLPVLSTEVVHALINRYHLEEKDVLAFA